MRLIDADMLKANCKYNREFQDRFKDVDLITLPELIDAQPTAYDQDKVVKQIEEKMSFYINCKKYGNKNGEELYRSYGATLNYEVTDYVEEIIEIIKMGGKEK